MEWAKNGKSKFEVDNATINEKKKKKLSHVHFDNVSLGHSNSKKNERHDT